MTANIALNEEQFRKLVAGGIVVDAHPSGIVVKIILSDIGFERMRKAIDDAEEGE